MTPAAQRYVSPEPSLNINQDQMQRVKEFWDNLGMTSTVGAIPIDSTTDESAVFYDSLSKVQAVVDPADAIRYSIEFTKYPNVVHDMGAQYDWLTNSSHGYDQQTRLEKVVADMAVSASVQNPTANLTQAQILNDIMSASFEPTLNGAFSVFTN